MEILLVCADTFTNNISDLNTDNPLKLFGTKVQFLVHNYFWKAYKLLSEICMIFHLGNIALVTFSRLIHNF